MCPPRREPVDKLLNFLARQSPEAARSFFADYLQGAPRPPSLASATENSQHHRRRLTIPLSDLEHSARSVNTSLHALALSAFAVALAEHCNHSDIVLGLVLSGRTVLVDVIADMVAPCITAVPVRVRYIRSSATSWCTFRVIWSRSWSSNIPLDIHNAGLV